MNYRARIPAVIALTFLSQPTSADMLSSLKWKHRPVVVFAKSENDERLKQQRSALSGASAELRERQIAVIYVIGDRADVDDAPDRLRARFGVGANDFRVLLIGKDGGVKRSSSRPLRVGELTSTVDAMPMRKEEMKSQR